jgi:hypothetical protein
MAWWSTFKLKDSFDLVSKDVLCISKYRPSLPDIIIALHLDILELIAAMGAASAIGSLALRVYSAKTHQTYDFPTFFGFFGFLGNAEQERTCSSQALPKLGCSFINY